MSELPPQVRSVSRARLESVMREALRSKKARVRDWTWEPLIYHSVLPDRMLARVSGSALDDDNAPVRWSSVLKLFQPSAHAGTGELTTPPREILAYRSSLLAGLPGHLRAPRLLGIDEGDDGTFWLWLEDVTDMHGRRWPLTQFGLAARHLGVFNGTYLVSRAVPAEPWLNFWVARHLAAAGHREEHESDSAVWAELDLWPLHPGVARFMGSKWAPARPNSLRPGCLLETIVVFERAAGCMESDLEGTQANPERGGCVGITQTIETCSTTAIVAATTASTVNDVESMVASVGMGVTASKSA